jgi:hypothetical protein
MRAGKPTVSEKGRSLGEQRDAAEDGPLSVALSGGCRNPNCGHRLAVKGGHADNEKRRAALQSKLDAATMRSVPLLHTKPRQLLTPKQPSNGIYGSGLSVSSSGSGGSSYAAAKPLPAHARLHPDDDDARKAAFEARAFDAATRHAQSCQTSFAPKRSAKGARHSRVSAAAARLFPDDDARQAAAAKRAAKRAELEEGYTFAPTLSAKAARRLTPEGKAAAASFSSGPSPEKQGARLFEHAAKRHAERALKKLELAAQAQEAALEVRGADVRSLKEVYQEQEARKQHAADEKRRSAKAEKDAAIAAAAAAAEAAQAARVLERRRAQQLVDLERMSRKLSLGLAKEPLTLPPALSGNQSADQNLLLGTLASGLESQLGSPRISCGESAPRSSVASDGLSTF